MELRAGTANVMILRVQLSARDKSAIIFIPVYRNIVQECRSH
jgi:hypothetical protein